MADVEFVNTHCLEISDLSKKNSKRNYKVINYSELGIYGVSDFGHAQTSDPKVPLTDFCRATEEAAVNDYAAATRRRHAATLRAMCEASRGRQLRLIRAETDSGRSDGLLNTLTCRQPSARLHFLHPSPYAVYDVNFVSPVAHARTIAVASRNYAVRAFALKFDN